MEEFLAAAVVLSGIAFNNVLVIFLGLILLALFLWRWLTRSKKIHAPHISRSHHNPILSPIADHPWESQAVFNPAAVYLDGRVHLLYRALGNDGISRIGYASSADGIHFDERLDHPIFEASLSEIQMQQKFRNPFTSPARLKYDTKDFASGGGWGGSEDPRAVIIDNELFMTYCAFNGWESMRMALTAIDTKDFIEKNWHWEKPLHLSPPNQVHKNWVLFPEKIHGKYAILHALTPKILISYVDSFDEVRDNPIQSNNHRAGFEGEWDGLVRGAGAPPIKTKDGWLLFYHGMDPREPSVGYRVGAMLLDITDPTKILYRSALPILEPVMYYENDWKPGVVYASGAVVKDSILFLYYGGGDKTISVASANLDEFLHELKKEEHRANAPRV